MIWTSHTPISTPKRLASPRSESRSVPSSISLFTSSGLLPSLLFGLLFGLTAGGVFYPTQVFAQSAGLDIEILTPSTGSCVPNLAPVQPGGAPGDLPELQISDIPLSLSVTEPNGDPIVLSASVNGVPITLSQNTLRVTIAGAPELFPFLTIPADQVADGEDIELTIIASSGAGEVSDTVTFDLDRLPPSLEFTAEELSIFGTCDQDALTLVQGISPTMIDAFDPQPTLELSESESRCEVTQVIIARDHCGEGNGLEVIFQARRPALLPPDIFFSGIQEAGVYLEAYAFFAVDDNQGCYTTSAVRTRDQDPEEVASSGDIYEAPGVYRLTATAVDCAGTSYSEDVNFTIAERPYSDPGGPYAVDQGQPLTLSGAESYCPPELGGITDYTWNLNVADPTSGYALSGVEVEFVSPTGDDGVFPIGLRIETQSGQIEYAFTEVTVEDVDPHCDPGGPYEIDQGVYLFADASATTPGTIEEPVVAYRWDFGDGNHDPLQYFTTSPLVEYYYEQEGEFTITLSALDRDSECEGTTTVIVRDVEPIVQGLEVLSEGPFLEGDLLYFDAGSTTAGSFSEPIISYSWDWGDDTPVSNGSNLRFPSHQFTDSGTFEVCLTVDDGDSPVTGCLSVVIDDVSPRPYIEGDQDTVEGEEAHFTLSGTRAGSVYDALQYIEVDWGDGEVQRIDDVSVTDITHIFQADGTLEIIVSAHDEDSSAEVRWSIYVDDVSPLPALRAQGGPAQEGLDALWSAEESLPGALSDPIVYYRWSWGDGEVDEGADLSTASHAWPDDGTYELRLTLTDSDGSQSTTSRFVSVLNRPPFNGEILTDSDTVDLGEESRFEVRFEDVPEDTVSISWRMGEGSVYQDQRIVTHIYQQLGVFTIRATLLDEDGGENEVTRLIEVTPAGPRIIVGELPEVYEGETLSFDVELRAAEDGTGGIDGPVELRVLRAPRGMTWTALESPDPRLSTRYRFEWPVGATDSGEYLFKIKGSAPSGIERTLTRSLVALESRQVQLVTLGGSPAHALASVYTYEYDQDHQALRLTREGVSEIGSGIGHIETFSDYLCVSAPLSGHVAVIDRRDARLLRKIPIGGEPYALAVQAGYLWSFDARDGELVAIDRRLKVYRRAQLPQLRGALSVRAVTIDELELLAVLSRRGELWLINSEAILSNQINRAVLGVHLLRGAPIAQEEAVMGQLQVWRELDLLVAVFSRTMYAFDLGTLSQESLSPAWILESAVSLDSVTLHDGEIWSASKQGLRRFSIPDRGQGVGRRQVGELLDLNSQSVISTLPNHLLGESALVLGARRLLSHVSANSLRSILDLSVPNPKVLMILEEDHRDD